MSDKLENIILVGFMGAGKSSISKEISRILRFPYIDTDEIIEEAEGCSISELFQEKGEPYFRDLEHKLLQELLSQKKEKTIISTGGGMPVREENRALIRQLGFVVWLKTSEEKTLERVSANDSRPLLTEDDLEEKIHRMLKEREPIYEEVAQFEIETSDLSISEIASGIIDCASYYFSS